MGRARSARGLAYLAAAVAVHALLLLSVRDRPRVEAPSQTDLTVVETDVTTEAPEDVPARAAPRPEIASAARSPSSAARVAAGRERDDREEAEARGRAREPSVEAPEQTGAPDEKSGGWSLQPEQPVDLTSPGVVARATRGLEGEGPQTPLTGVSATGGVAEGLDAHDAAIGMGRGGPVLAALESAASGDDAPFEGAATFDVAIQTDGHVSVALLDGAGAVGEWTKVGEATRAALDPRRVRIPPGARGWHVVVRLEAKVQYPNGLDPKKLGPRVIASSTGPGVLGPSVSLAEMGKVCSVALTLGLTLSPISGGCDPSNIGARTLRVVHGHITSEGRL
jgi:hypothetical protein